MSCLLSSRRTRALHNRTWMLECGAGRAREYFATTRTGAVLDGIGALLDPITRIMRVTKSLRLEDSVTLIACLILHRLFRDVPSLAVCLTSTRRGGVVIVPGLTLVAFSVLPPLFAKNSRFAQPN